MADAMAAYELLGAFPRGLAEAELEVELHCRHDRQPLSPEDEQRIEAVWAERCMRHPSLFNGLKFRFAGLEPTASGCLRLQLGLTNYRDFLGTNAADCWPQLLAAGERHLASALGNAAVVETADGQVLLLRRSGDAPEVPSATVLPGGHPEPSEIGVATAEDWRAAFAGGGAGAGAALAARARRELWDAVLREIVEETAAPRESLHEPLCLALTRRLCNLRPVIVFLVRCDLAAARIVERYDAGQAVDRFESTRLFALPREAFVRRALDPGGGLEMVGCQLGGVAVYREYLQQTCAAAG